MTPLLTTDESIAPKPENDQDPVKRPALTTNRKKAIIFIQLFCLAFAACSYLMKYTMNTKKVDPLDICLFRMFVLFTFSISLTKINGHDFDVPRESRSILFVRCIMGTIGQTLLTFGMTMVPLVVL